jgi:hypothetical protein
VWAVIGYNIFIIFVLKFLGFYMLFELIRGLFCVFRKISETGQKIRDVQV